MMLTAQVRECTDCGSVERLLEEIDCTLTHYGRNHLMNLAFDSKAPHCRRIVSALLHYRRILTKKRFNTDYACAVELTSVFSRIKTLLIKKDCCKLAENCDFPTADTFDEVSAS